MVSPAPTSHGVPAWLIRFCQQLSTTWGVVASAIFNIALSLFSTWLFTANDTDYAKLPLYAALFRHWRISLVAFVLLALLYGLVWAIGKLPVVTSPATLKKRYLSRSGKGNNVTIIPSPKNRAGGFLHTRLKPFSPPV